jgi:hypothetical protein
MAFSAFVSFGDTNGFHRALASGNTEIESSGHRLG